MLEHKRDLARRKMEISGSTADKKAFAAAARALDAFRAQQLVSKRKEFQAGVSGFKQRMGTAKASKAGVLKSLSKSAKRSK